MSLAFGVTQNREIGCEARERREEEGQIKKTCARFTLIPLKSFPRGQGALEEKKKKQGRKRERERGRGHRRGVYLRLPASFSRRLIPSGFVIYSSSRLRSDPALSAPFYGTAPSGFPSGRRAKRSSLVHSLPSCLFVLSFSLSLLFFSLYLSLSRSSLSAAPHILLLRSPRKSRPDLPSHS